MDHSYNCTVKDSEVKSCIVDLLFVNDRDLLLTGL